MQATMIASSVLSPLSRPRVTATPFRSRAAVRCQCSSNPREERPAQRLATGAAALAAAVLLATTGGPDPALAANMRLKGTSGAGQGEDKYLGGVDAKRLQSARRKEALAKRKEQALAAGGSLTATEAPSTSDAK